MPHKTMIRWAMPTLLKIYIADSLNNEGFIHCSKKAQLVKVANRFFFNQKDLVILCIDADQVKAEIRYEEAEIGELFPHIYGELNIDAMFRVVEFQPGEDGFFELPQGVINL